MRCTELRAMTQRRAAWQVCPALYSSLALVLLAGCASSPSAPPATATKAAEPIPARSAAAPTTGAAHGPVRLSAPGPVRSLDELRLQAARRIVAANPHLTYSDRTPDVLLAIPVLAIDLNADGSIHRIEALRLPRQAKDTTQIAIEAVQRASPFGDLSRLPRPWRITETFLFNDERRFKPRTLDTQ